jgi:hypothetical protein
VCCGLFVLVSLQAIELAKLATAMHELALNQHLTRTLLQGVSVESTVTPSGVISVKGGKGKYDRAMTLLGLNLLPIKQDVQQEKKTARVSRFEWRYIRDGKSMEKKEGESYLPTLTALKEWQKDLKIAVTGDGKNVAMGGLLFDEKIYTLRKDDPYKHGQRVEYVTQVKGRSDIVIRKQWGDDQPVTKGDVAVAIEVKPPSVLEGNQDGCKREAVMQLVGLCARNPHGSPPVILTNLVSSHWVFFLKNTSQAPLNFQVHEVTFSDIGDAIEFALQLPECEHVLQFGRPNSPLSSVEHSGSDEGASSDYLFS